MSAVPPGTATTRQREVVVIGGGQAGLAIGYLLAQHGRRFTILEAAGEPAAAWRTRWDSLELFTPVRYDSLPGLTFPGDPDSYPGRQNVVAYLTDYAQRFELPVEFNSRVRSVRPGDGGFLVELADRTYEANQVVVATGPFQVPFTPAIAADLSTEVAQLHSSDYRSPGDLPPGAALVVGGGNTGFQIAAELAQSREVHLAVGARQTPLPQRILGRDLFRYLEATRLMNKTVTSRIGQRMKDKETLIGSSPRRARRRGIKIRPRATGAQGSKVTFADGSEVAVDAVVWATGFRLDHSFVELPVFDARGQVKHQRGVTELPGLYFLGLPWQHTRGSALLGWVKDDAEFIAQRIGAFARARHCQRAALAVALRSAGTMTAATAATPHRFGLHTRGMAVGLASGLAAIAFTALLPDGVAYIYLGAQLAGVGWVYFGFGVADGRPSAIAIQVLSAGAFLTVGFLGAYHESTAVLGVGFLAHGGWDWLHHNDHGPTHVRTWYPPFCVVVDVVIGLPLLAGWVL